MLRSHFTYSFIALIIALVLSGCAFAPLDKGPPSESELERLAVRATERGDFEEAGRRYRELADTASELKRPGYLLQAATVLLSGNHVAPAQKILAGLDTRKLSTAQALRANMIAARIALAQNNPTQALDALKAGVTADLPPALRAEAHELRAYAYRRNGDLLASARELVLREAAFAAADSRLVAGNQQNIWQTLIMLSDEDLQRGIKPPPDVFAGWREMATIAKAARTEKGDIAEIIAAWRARYPGHPAAQEIIDLVIARQKEEVSRPARIAVLLPQSGAMAEVGAALRDGFIAAHYRRDNQSYAPSIRFYDVGADAVPVDTIYAQAVADGADFIVGPLTKQAVGVIAQSGRLTVPTLALNYHERNVSGSSRLLYQFGLAPEDEARQVAQRAWLDGHNRALAIVPEGEWGERVLQAFRKDWEQLGGTLLEVQTYPSENNDYSDQIKRLFNLDDSERRHRALQGILQQPLQFEPRRRQDGDFIFMAAFPRQARLIRPQFKFHYAGRLPVYSTSHVFGGKRDPDADRDIDDVIFCDIPWVLGGGDQQAKLEIERLSSDKSGQYVRFYALGVDAYNIIPFLKNPGLFRYERFKGQTGVLQLGEDNQVFRQLQWARFSNGLARPYN